MLQRIDIIVYYVVMDRYPLCAKAGAIVCMRIVGSRTLVPWQAFRLGMSGMVARQLACNINRNWQILVKEMSHCSCGGRLLSISITGNPYLRHRFLRFRSLLSAWHCRGEYQQDCRADEFNKPLHLLLFWNCKGSHLFWNKVHIATGILSFPHKSKRVAQSCFAVRLLFDWKFIDVSRNLR